MKIKTKSMLRYKINQVSEEAGKELCEGHPKPIYDHEIFFEPYKKGIEYDNKLFRDELMPLYDQMVSLFTDKYWLATPSTRNWYSIFSDFVDLWHRWLDESIPADVIKKIDISEEQLQPFYTDLGNQLNELQKKLSGETTD